ncbi:YicC/YloC family endoribonuclease, partial [Desulfovibrio sp.]|uniref:YicC/YloC family endoribonuclease n=1 Tax=Desulfovibrio sp. TaxID=885 RepID=UPI0023D1451B
MLRSMTGFGRCLVENADSIQQWEVKSVNGRHLDLKWRLPPAIRCLEPLLEKVVRRHASRGRVDVSLTLQRVTGAPGGSGFDAALAASMLDSLACLARARGDAFTPDYAALLTVPALWGENGGTPDEALVRQLEDGLGLALTDWNQSRAAEGAALAADLDGRLRRMEAWTEKLADCAPAIKKERAEALRARVGELLAPEGLALEEARFLQEVAVLMDRLDVSEELTRLGAHLARMRELLREGRDAGRRLDFTLQECFREINTCGNKIPDIQLSRLVVDFKNELEKCREQVQN